VKLFDYDTKEPLSYTVTYEEQQDGVTVQDITYPSGGGDRFGKLVIPDGRGPFPAVLYAAGQGVPASFFVREMVAFAKDGYAGLALEHRPTTDLYSSLDGKATIEGYANYVKDLRRGLDLLGTIPKIDVKRLGFVGHSFGCAAGSILSGLETRIRAYVLMACGGYITDPAWSYCATDACYTATTEDRARYQERLSVLNPANYIGRNSGAAFLVQASKTDQFARQPNVEALFAAAPEPKSITWYPDRGSHDEIWTFGGHDLGCTGFGACDPTLPAFAEHRAWLKEHV
jgi:cephalosporin-C deacetylase-like acetyl esterase